MFHGSPYEMQTEMSRGPLAVDEHSRKGNGRPAFGRPPPHFLFCRGHPLPSPLHVCLHFIRRSMGNLYYFLMLMLMNMLMLMLYVFNFWFICCFFKAWQHLTYFCDVFMFSLHCYIFSFSFGDVWFVW